MTLRAAPSDAAAGNRERAAPPGGIRLSLVLPAHDERENLAPLLARACALLPRVAKEFEILVVDDGSADGTARVAARWSEVRLLRHPRNRGYGAALRTGLRAARLEWVLFADADLQFDLEDLPRLLEAARASGADVVAGYRAPRRDPFHRRALGFAWSRLVDALFGTGVRDVDCGFKLFRRAVLEAIPIASVGAFVNTEILVRARAAGFRIVEVPVRHFPRRSGVPSGARPRVVARALRELWALRRELAPPRGAHLAGRTRIARVHRAFRPDPCGSSS